LDIHFILYSYAGEKEDESAHDSYGKSRRLEMLFPAARLSETLPFIQGRPKNQPRAV
jgi:hypothetical protein